MIIEKLTSPVSIMERFIHPLGDEVFRCLQAGEIQEIPAWFWLLVATKAAAEVREIAAQEGR